MRIAGAVLAACAVGCAATTPLAAQGRALQFQQLNDPYVKDHLRFLAHPAVSEEFTVEFWMQADDSIPFCATKANPQGCWSTGDTWFFGNFIFDGHQNFEQNPGRDSFDVVLANRGRVKVVLDPGNTETDGATDVVTGGGWHHVAVVREWTGASGHRVRIYVDGAVDGEVVYSGRDPLQLIFPYWGTERADWAGANPADYPDYFGRIDEIRYWSVARSQAEIQATMHTELTGTEPGLVHYLRLNEGQGTLANDMVGNDDGIFFHLQPDSWVVSTAPLASLPGPDCGDGVRNRNEDGVDCGGVCPPCPPLTEIDCSNGADDDFDGLTDCQDPDCAGPACDGFRVESDDRDADYNPLEGVSLGNYYDRSQICFGDDGGRWWQMGLQFRVTIPAPATILSARIDLTSSGDNQGDVTTELRAIALDDLQPFVPGAGPSFRDSYPLTSAAVAWSPAATAEGTVVSTPDLAALVQEVVDRPGWSAGGHVGFVLMEDLAPPVHWRCFRDRFAGDGSEAVLRVDYLEQGTPVCIEAIDVGDEIRVGPEPPGGCPSRPGAVARDFVYGAVPSIGVAAGSVELGAVRCVAGGLGTTEEIVPSRDPDLPPGAPRFYLARATGAPGFGPARLPDGTQPQRTAEAVSCP